MIVLITPTGARPDQFAMCKRWMKQQTYKGEAAWIIVDDAVPVTTHIITDEFRPNWTIHKVRPVPPWSFGMNTQGRNMTAALNYLLSNIQNDSVQAIFIIEDDDYYKPRYLDGMMERLGNYWALGETNTIYYNVVTRSYADMNNRTHASLFETAFTMDVVEIMRNAHKFKFIDAEFWKNVPNKKLFSDDRLAIGMKGMPGRGGIGAGHRGWSGMSRDNELRWLIKEIGISDAEQYKGYYRNSGVPQHAGTVKKLL